MSEGKSYYSSSQYRSDITCDCESKYDFSQQMVAVKGQLVARDVNGQVGGYGDSEAWVRVGLEVGGNVQQLSYNKDGIFVFEVP